MPEITPLNSTLQESVLALLAHSDTHGRVVAQLVSPNVFTGDYKAVAEACLRYWKQQGRAPGAHLDDELAHLLDKTSRRAQTFRQIIGAMHRLSAAMNTGYVLGKVQSFVRMQELKDTMVKTAAMLNAPGGELKLEEVEKAFTDLLKQRRTSFDAGQRLSNYEHMLAWLELQDEFRFGIPQLDDNFIVPMRGTVTLFLGAAKRGKSWFLVNTGRTNLVSRRKRVLHITLEMAEAEVMMRYYQALFKITKRSHEEPERLRLFEMEEGKLVDFGEREVRPEFTLDSDNVREELGARIMHYPGRFEELLVKRWAPRVVDEGVLNGYLDQLEQVEGFIPDLCILDYMGLWRTKADNHRITLGRAFEDFRRICIERNMAGVTAHQLSKLGDSAHQAHAGNVAEDWSMIGTADQVLVYSSTDWEFEKGLGRIYVDRARNERDRFGLVLTQNYSLGQFCMDSIRLPSNYLDLLPKKPGKDEEDEDDNT